LGEVAHIKAAQFSKEHRLVLKLSTDCDGVGEGAFEVAVVGACADDIGEVVECSVKQAHAVEGEGQLELCGLEIAGACGVFDDTVKHEACCGVVFVCVEGVSTSHLAATGLFVEFDRAECESATPRGFLVVVFKDIELGLGGEGEAQAHERATKQRQSFPKRTCHHVFFLT